MKNLIFIFFIGFFLNNYSQDTIRRFNSHFDVNTTNDIRLGVGFQNSFSYEIGYAHHKTNSGDTGFFSKGYFTSVEYIPKTASYNSIVGLKTGYEIATLLGAVAIETKYQTNFDQTDFVITPKLGVGFGSFLFLTYGFNISTNNNPFPNVSRHQISFIVNFPVTTKTKYL